MATGGLGAILVFLTLFAVSSALGTRNDSAKARLANQQSDAYSDARSAVGDEESLGAKYRLAPGPDVRNKFQVEANNLVKSLGIARSLADDQSERVAIDQVLTLQQGYLISIDRMFAAVDAGDTQRALAIERNEVDPAFTNIDAAVEKETTAHHGAALTSLGKLQRSEQRAVATTPIAFGVGLGLVGLLWLVIAGYRRHIGHWALHDPLTGLPNRLAFDVKAREALAQGRRTGASTAFILLDLDRFKEINDTLGHRYGDLLLQQMGPRLTEELRSQDFVARFGGDEFVLLLPGLASTDTATAVARRVLASVGRPFTVEGAVLDVEASAGVVMAPEHGDDVELLLQHVDVAMYAAKDRRSAVEVYDPALDLNNPQRLALLGDLRRAIETEQLLLHFQPKLELNSERVIGVEALVRWQRAGALIPPMEFVPLAERTGLIGPLTGFVLKSALRQCRLWQDSGLAMPVSVNISARNLLDEDFVGEVSDQLAASGVGPELLMLELTESAVMADPERALAVLQRLHAMGVKIAIDDFGTGYSSMAYLKRLPVDELKIDRGFVSNMEHDADDAIIVRSVLDLARNMGLSSVAEGVEDGATWDRLQSMGCDAAQGYFMSRPLPADELTEWLSTPREALRQTVAR